MPEPMPKGLVFFSSDAPPAYRRRRTVFAVIYLAGFLSLIWPVAALVDGPRPLVLGLPLALAWIVLWLAIIFAGLVWLYRKEPPEPPPSSSSPPETGPHEPQ